VSDGRKYVFASNTAGSAHSSIQAFSMETGMFIGDLETCGFPYSVEYAPHREEVWTHCWSPDHEEGSRARDGHPGDEGHIDVFSTNALGLDHEQVVLGYANETGLISGHGCAVARPRRKLSPRGRGPRPAEGCGRAVGGLWEGCVRAVGGQ